MPDRTCPACGETFTPTWHNQKACPPTDADRARVKGQAVSRCARRVLNAKQRDQAPDYLPMSAAVVSYDCAQCGTSCTPGENVVAHATRFCGQACKRYWHHEQRPSTAPTRRAKAQAKLARAALGQQGHVAVWTAGVCVQCGGVFVSAHPDTMTCSCRCSLERKRTRRRGHRARARLHGVAYEPITPRKVFIRDSYCCRLCGKATKATAVVPHPRAPTLDHIVPMSLGGPHLYVNVQCACFMCNSRKAARLAGDQLLLIG